MVVDVTMPDIMTLTFISGLVQAIPIIVAIVLGIFTYILLRSEVSLGNAAALFMRDKKLFA